ncbi:MAG: hypothetical protein ABR579_05460, partial [Actinomycetota bacterium]
MSASASDGRAVLRTILVVLTVMIPAALILPPVSIAAPGDPSIAFLNPYQDPQDPNDPTVNPTMQPPGEVSAKQDTDTAYHFVMTTANVPANPAVELEADDAIGNTTTLGEATRVNTNTWEFFWGGNLNGQLDGNGPYVIRAVLYRDVTVPGTGTEVARAEVKVTLNNEDAMDDPSPFETEDQGQTVELTYPLNGGPLGYYNVSSTSTNFVMDGVVSAAKNQSDNGTTYVKGFYTTSALGTDPKWIACGGYSSVTPPNVRMRCNLTAPDKGSDITGVMMLTNDTRKSNAGAAGGQPNDDSTDAHAVFPYLQVPTSVQVTQNQNSVNPASDGSFDCKLPIVSTVSDQSGRPMAGVNVDVHAQGPTDQLKFNVDTSGSTATAANQPPNKGKHASEAAWSCSGGSTSGNQGEVNVIATPDIKHIESASGTNTSGQFTFGLHTDNGGGTQITSWADTVDDDLFCNGEPFGTASIGWGQLAPNPVMIPNDNCVPPSTTPTVCSSSSPASSSPAATSSALSSATATATATATSSTSPPTTGCTGPREVKTNLTIRYDKGDKAFEGRARSKKPRCRR